MWWKPQALEKQAEADRQAERSQGGTRNQCGSTVDSARGKAFPGCYTPGMVTHACNPSTGQHRRESQEFNTWATWDFVSKNWKKKIKTEHSEGNDLPAQKILEKSTLWQGFKKYKVAEVRGLCHPRAALFILPFWRDSFACPQKMDACPDRSHVACIMTSRHPFIFFAGTAFY